jgi:RNA polymerase sigma-70 factor, ECF subfamily
MMITPDRINVTLLAAARSGNAQALGVLLQSLQPYLLSIARRKLPCHLRGKCDGADLVQETLLEAHRHFGRFDGIDSDDLRVWLCGILNLNLKDCLRRYRDASKRSINREWPFEARDAELALVDPYPTPCAYSIVQEDVAALRQALSRLPEHERFVITLRYFDLFAFDEIGQRLGCSPEAARKLCSRAIARLRRMLRVARDPET